MSRGTRVKSAHGEAVGAPTVPNTPDSGKGVSHDRMRPATYIRLVTARLLAVTASFVLARTIVAAVLQLNSG